MTKWKIATVLCAGMLGGLVLGVETMSNNQLQAKPVQPLVQEKKQPVSSKISSLANQKIIELPDLSGFTESDTVLEQVIKTETGEEMSYFVGPSAHIGKSVTKLATELNGNYLQIAQPNMTKVDRNGKRMQHIYGGEVSLQTSTNLLMAVTPPGEVPSRGTVYEPILSNKTTRDDFSYGYKVAENGLKTFKVAFKTKVYNNGQAPKEWPPAGFPEEPLAITMVISGLPTGFAIVDYYVTNTSDQAIENFSLMKTIDTQLGYDDRVIPRAMGNDAGVYIDNFGDKMYYIFNSDYTEHPPENWLGSKYSGKIGDRLFGPLNTLANGPSFETISSSGQENSGFAIGAPYFDYSIDSQMVMKNSPMTLPAGATTGFSYAVSLVTPVNQLSINPPRTLTYNGGLVLDVKGTWVDTEAGNADLYYQIGNNPDVKFASNQANGTPGGLNPFEVSISKRDLELDTEGKTTIKFKAVNLTTQRESKVSETAVQLAKKKVSVRYLFEDSQEEVAPSETVELLVGTHYDYPPLEIPGYTYDYTDGKSSGIVSGGEIAITHHYLTNHYGLKIEGSLLNKQPAIAAKQGEVIDYKISLNSKVKKTGKTYQDVAFKAVLPESLTEFTDVTFSYIDEQGERQEAGPATIKGQQLTTSLGTTTIANTQDLIVTFKARVKPTAQVGEKLSVNVDVSGKLSDGTLLKGEPAQAYVTTVLESPLELVSVPDTIDFGDVRLNGQAQLVTLKSLDQDVQVQDMLVGRKWSLAVELTKEFTGAKTKKELTGLMKFKQNGTITEFGQGNQVQVTNNQTTTGELVNISKDWVAKQEGFVLDFSDDNTQYK